MAYGYYNSGYDPKVNSMIVSEWLSVYFKKEITQYDLDVDFSYPIETTLLTCKIDCIESRSMTTKHFFYYNHSIWWSMIMGKVFWKALKKHFFCAKSLMH